MKQLAVVQGQPRLQLDAPWPVPGPHDVLIKVHYCNASTFDIETHKIFAQDSDHVFVGGFVTGHVVQLGTDVDTTRFHVDCLVIGYVPLDHGSSILSEYCICPEWSTLQVKEDTPLRKVCAALPGAVMAYELFQGRTRLMAGDRVLVLDGNSSSGNVIAQLAARWGAQVYATAADANNHQQLKEAAYIVHAFLDDGTGTNVVQKALESTFNIGFDFVVQTLEGTMDIKRMKELAPLLSSHGVLAVKGTQKLHLTSAVMAQLSLKGCSLTACHDASWSSGTQQGRLLHIFHAIADEVHACIVEPRVREIVTLDDICSRWTEELPRGPVDADGGARIVSFLSS